jgi:polar amino acid transport system substrate-binding protein
MIETQVGRIGPSVGRDRPATVLATAVIAGLDLACPGHDGGWARKFATSRNLADNPLKRLNSHRLNSVGIPSFRLEIPSFRLGFLSLSVWNCLEFLGFPWKGFHQGAVVAALRRLCGICVALCALLCPTGARAASQALVPGFWDPALRLDRPDLSGVRAIRFLTADDYPPLNFVLPDGTLSGFNVEIARAVCEELEIGCTIQARRFDTLVDSLETGKGDAVIASIAATPAARAHVDFSQPYYQTPARFVGRKGAAPADASARALAGRSIGVVGGSSHEAYLKAFFPAAKSKPYPNASALEAALRASEIDAAFGDGLTFAVWLNGESSQNCCAFFGGPYGESRFFGEGVGIAVRTDDTELRKALNWALARVFSRGRYAEIYLKYFPVGFY